MTRSGKAKGTTEARLGEVGALFDEGRLFLEARDLNSAEACFRRALDLAPELAETHCNLGVVLEKGGHTGPAEGAYRNALQLDPDNLQVLLNLVALLTGQKRFGEAIGVCEGLLEAHAGVPAAWSARGILFTCMKQDEAAEHCFRTALELDPTYAKARFNLSYLLLRHGRFEEGWPALEARPWSLELEGRIPAPRWQGESLMGKSLLIGAEGGHGDTIQFCRFATQLKTLGAARVGILCHPTLQRLLRSHPDLDDVMALGDTVSPGWDFWTLPLSLPHHCGSRFDTMPAPGPYLQARPEDIESWCHRLPNGGLRVGLAWKGNPQFENDADRSLPGLTALAPLALGTDLHFISFQKGVGEAACAQPPAGMALFNPSPWIRDFADAAALMTQVDLVITVDTAAAHLAGALGRPCWILLPHHKTDWRWFTDREDSPWYPKARLFRQEVAGEWGPVIEAVATSLRTFRQTHPS